MEKKIMEGNAKIAKFRGMVWNAIYQQWCFEKEPGWYKVEELKFHSSWDWLIPAWSKLYQTVHKRYLEMGESQARIWLTHKTQVFQSAIGDNDIMRAFNELLFGIEWYNNHVSKEQTT